MEVSPIYFWCEKLSFSDYKGIKIVLFSYLQVCDLYDVIEEEPNDGLPKRIREKKEEKTLGGLIKAMHPEVWMYIDGDCNSPYHVWKKIDGVVTKHARKLPKEH